MNNVSLSVSPIGRATLFSKQKWWLECSYPDKPGMSFMVGEFYDVESAFLAMERLGKVLKHCYDYGEQEAT